MKRNRFIYKDKQINDSAELILDWLKIIVRWSIAFFFSILCALIGKVLMEYNTFSLVFVFSSVFLAYLHISRSWGWFKIIFISFFLFIIPLSLKTYIDISFGA